MSQAASPPTLRSTWTPRYNKAANEKIFQERLELIKKWYSAWNDGQRWELVEFVLLNLSDTDLHYIHSLLDPLMPRPPPPPPPPIRQDFTRIFPRHLSLKIFSCLDPRTLCRAAQVSWYWRYLSEQNILWKVKCLRYNWFLPDPPIHNNPSTIWKRHYMCCVNNMYWKPPQALPYHSPSPSPSTGVTCPVTPPIKRPVKRRRRRVRRHTHHEGTFIQPFWKPSNKYPKDLITEIKVTNNNNTKGTLSNTYKSNALSRQVIESVKSELSEEKLDKQQVTNEEEPNNGLVDTWNGPMINIDTVLHPSLLEKLRLGSPNSDNVFISTINHSSNVNSQELTAKVHNVQSKSPFPSLPPYYLIKEKKMNDTSELHTESKDNELIRLWEDKDFLSKTDSDSSI